MRCPHHIYLWFFPYCHRHRMVNTCNTCVARTKYLLHSSRLPECYENNLFNLRNICVIVNSNFFRFPNIGNPDVRFRRSQEFGSYFCYCCTLFPGTSKLSISFSEKSAFHVDRFFTAIAFDLVLICFDLKVIFT